MSLVHDIAMEARNDLSVKELDEKLRSAVNPVPQKSFIILPEDHPIICEIESRHPWNRLCAFIKRRFAL